MKSTILETDQKFLELAGIGRGRDFKQILNSQILVNFRISWLTLSGKINPTLFNSSLALCTAVTGYCTENSVYN
jgi:hypothetical protein